MNVGELKRLADDLSLFIRQALPRQEYTKGELINLITSGADNKDILTAIVDAGEQVTDLEKMIDLRRRRTPTRCPAL